MDLFKSGEVLAGRFEIGSMFLICRFSTLYHAVDKRGLSRTPVVIRMLRLPPGGDEQRRNDVRVQIEREGAMLSQLHHPNLPAVLEVGHHAQHTFLVLEDFEGITLDVFMKQVGSVDVPYVYYLMQQLLHMLDYLHALDPPIIHRDLRPHSLVLGADGVLKAAEFGLARINEPGTPAETLFRSEGSSNYAPPEQLTRVASAPANDIYAVGATLYFLLTHEHPPKSIDRATGVAEIRPLSEIRSDIPPALEAIITRMMDPARGKRYASAGEVFHDVNQAFPDGLS